MSPSPRITPRISGLVLPTRDPARLRAFYVDAFGVAPTERGFNLGEERIALAAAPHADLDVFAANETGFQHFAIIVADMAAAYAHLRARAGWRPISLRGPEALPQASGGATAFKFRDPEGRPLELLQFAREAVPPFWRDRFAAAPGRLFQGVDHTAITVRDAQASRTFYAELGLSCARRQINAGAEQARLDGFEGTGDVEVAISSLSLGDRARPGVELLEYRRPPTAVRAAPDGSAAATRVEMIGVGQKERALRDPDGHRLNYGLT